MNIHLKKPLLTILSLLILPLTAIAAGETGSGSGTVGGGGGDISCDAKIQDIVKNIQFWVSNKGDRSGIQLDLTSSLHPTTHLPFTHAQYENEMNELLKRPVDANCVKPGDRFYPVEVGNSAKICRTSVDDVGIHMVCDRDLFMQLIPDNQIKQIHHELAILLPGLEPVNGPISTYKISNQLSAFIEDISERRLVVMTEKSKEYTQVVRCQTTRGPEVGVFLNPRAVQYLIQNKMSGIAGGSDSHKYSFSVEFMDDDKTITQLFSKSWPWHGVVPVLTGIHEYNLPSETQLIQAKYEFTSPVQTMKINGETFVKFASFKVRSKIETYKISFDQKLESHYGSMGSPQDIKRILDTETENYVSGLVDSEINCTLNGMFL